MKKKIVSTFAIVVTLSSLAASQVIATTHNLSVNNLSRDKIDVYIRGEGAESPAKPHASLDGKTKKTVQFNRADAYMDVVVVSHGSTPDWNPTGGTCKHLLTTTNHTVVLDDSKLGLKFSCETVK